MSQRYFTVRVLLDTNADAIARHGCIDCVLLLNFQRVSAGDESEALACAARTLGALRLTDYIDALEIAKPDDLAHP